MILAIVAALAIVAVFVARIAPGVVAERERAAVAATVAEAGAVDPPGGREVAIHADAGGDYVAVATVDGHTLDVVIDTGASTVALTAGTARRLGLKLAESDFTGRIATANGVVAAAPIVLSEVRVGAIAVRDVDAVVVPGDALATNLLGLSFLNRLRKVEVGGGQLVLIN
jgi:aspartyl protease family protein